MPDTLETVCRVLSSVSDRKVLPDDTLTHVGLDSMDMIEVILDLEEWYPDLDFDGYLPTADATARAIAADIDRMTVGK